MMQKHKPLTIVDLIIRTGKAKSRSQAKRLIKQGAVSIKYDKEVK